jgi:hypothetical protein
MADRHIGMAAHVKQHNLFTLLLRIKFHQPRSSDSAAMRFCLPILAHAPLHHDLGRCNLIKALAEFFPRIRPAIMSIVSKMGRELGACGICAGTQAARDALQRTWGQVQRGARVDALCLPQSCQGPLAVCCNNMQAQLVSNRPALKQDVVACALVVLKLLLQQS